MEILIYNEIDLQGVKKTFDKVVEQLKKGDFASAEIKKMQNTGYYRAKMDYEDRLLFKFAKIEGTTYLLLLEVIKNHDYEKSRFLRGAEIDESKLQTITKPEKIPAEDLTPVAYINPQSRHFHLLDKIISFDTDQNTIFRLPTPIIIIGSAGSGKTALTLEKIKTLKGNILYVTLSPYLVESAANLYYSFNYENEEQEVDFLSFKDFVQSLQVIEGKEITFKEFDTWFMRYRNSIKIRDSYKLFEEFKGVLTGNDITKAYLSKADYLGLGVRQSVFFQDEREIVYSLFEKYLQFLSENKYYDLNIISHQWLQFVENKYDFVIVDEVQDLTNIQLYLILKSLQNSNSFVLCGDSNQIVHPNFFSWSNVKSMFYKTDMLDNDVRILKTNYRNSSEVTTLANTLLKIKHLRFGSVDRESTYLVSSISSKKGEIVYLEDTAKVKQDLNQKTKSSTRFAVLVMNNTDKAEVRKYFQTPLLFSIQEAKGLEYDNIILVNFVSNNTKEFNEVAADIEQEDINQTQELNYSRAKDKTDKSLDVYKFYVNSLYVAFTRSVQNLYIVEANKKHQMLHLLGLVNTKQLELKEQKSSMDDWKKEAQKLEKQGKQEQTDLIKKNILGIQAPNWTPTTVEMFEKLQIDALNPDLYNKKAKDQLFDYALIYNREDIIKKLSDLKYRRADNYKTEYNSLYRKHYAPYKTDDMKQVMPLFNKYGINFRDEFNFTPLMTSVRMGSRQIAKFLLDNGADTEAVDNYGNNCFQIAIVQTTKEPKYMSTTFSPLYNKLAPTNIKVKVDNQLIKIDPHKAEFLILNAIIALQHQIISSKHLGQQGIQMDDLIKIFEKYPNKILAAYRKKRSYINSIMSKNETDSNDKNNKKLFLRRKTGYYVLNPNLEIMVGEEWVNIYHLLCQEKLYKYEAITNAIRMEYLGFMGDSKYDLPISKFQDIIAQGKKKHTVRCILLTEGKKVPIEPRIITHLDAKGETSVSSMYICHCQVPQELGGGAVAVHFKEKYQLNQYLRLWGITDSEIKIPVTFELHSETYAYAHLL